MRALVLLLAVPLVLAGCVQAPNDDPPTGTANVADDVRAAVQALVADLPCEADVGSGTTENLLKLGEWRVEEGDLGEVDVRGNLALLVRHQLGGLHILDIGDPREPRLLGTLPLDETAGLDVKWTATGEGALIGDFGAIHLVDLTDPANPTLRGTFSYENASIKGQAHMVTTRVINGEEWVFVATQTTNQPLHVLKREGWNLTHAASYGTVPILNTLPLGSHDVTIVNDTLLDDKPVMYLADGLAGWSAHDLTDPAKPTRIGGTLSPEPGPGYTHTVRVGFHEGKRIVVTMAEVGLNTLKVYDATDLQTPILLARWNADPARPHIPQHNLQLHGDTLYMAHYTEGIYVFNLSNVITGPPVLGTLAMKPTAHWSVEEPQEPSALGFANVWDVVLANGIIWIADLNGTFTSVAFGCMPVMDPAHTRTE